MAPAPSQMAFSADLTLFNLATVLVVLLIQNVQFCGYQSNKLLSYPTSSNDGFDAKELCRAIEGTDSVLIKLIWEAPSIINFYGFVLQITQNKMAPAPSQMASSADLTLFNLATVLVVLLIQNVQFCSCQPNESPLSSLTSSDDGFNAKELCRAIEGTEFHEQCLHSEVVKQKGFIPRNLRPPWLNSLLFEDNQLPEEKALANGCYGCYKGSTASNGVNPDEEYCACAVHFYQNEPETEPDDYKDRTLVLLDGCITGASHNCTANVKIQFSKTRNICYGENITVFENTIHLKESSGKDIGAASTFTFPMEFRHWGCRSRWHQLFELWERPYYDYIMIIISGDCGTKSFSLPQLTSFRGNELGKRERVGRGERVGGERVGGRVQEIRGLHLDLRQEVAAVQWRDQFGAYDFVRHNDLSWQPTDLKLINDYGMPNQGLMYPNFVTKSIGHANFSVDISKVFYHHNKKNAVVSPLSAAIALAMAYIGARGQTAVELGKVLAAGDSSGPSLRDNYGKFLQEIESTQTDANFKLKISKKLYLSNSVKVLDEFKSAIRKNFGEDSFESIDFGKQIEVADKINAFLDNASPGGKSIESIVPQSLNPLVLVSAIHFGAKWLRQFNPQYNEKKTFRSINGQYREMDMMTQTGQFMHMETEDFELVGVPFVGEKAHFVIMLRKPNRYRDYVFQKFNGENLMEFLKKSTMKELKVILPKFKIVSLHQNLEETLLLLGIKRAFRPSKADFSGINHNNLSYTLYINKVIQKVHILIDEDGTAASPSESKSIGSSFGLPKVDSARTFQPDRPFAFFITLHKKHVIFSGFFTGEQ
uniref:Serpin domain-containing protein n=1 Tax=Globodera rostochiensis TaxID=31243 RepID=A0A914IE68_GLORO